MVPIEGHASMLALDSGYPVLMEQALRPHRGGTVLALGILSLVAGIFLVPLGLVAWIIGSRDLKRMNRGELDPAGRSLTQIGLVFGIASSVLWLGHVACVSVFMMGSRTSYSLDATGAVRTAQLGFTMGPFRSAPPPGVHEYEYQERISPSGEWLKDGPFLRRARSGAKLEEGSYRAGKREGEWTFWNEGGSIDLDRSGIYENDVRVQAGATPLGDYWHEEVDLGPVEKFKFRR